MIEWAYANLTHVLCGLLLVARIGDVLTTYLATPRLLLEGNPLARRLGWPFALLTLAVCGVAYISTGPAVAILITSLLVSGGNALRVWFVRALGEEAQWEMLIAAARKTSLWHALASVWSAAGFLALAGGVILLFYPTAQAWGFWAGMGIVVYGAAVGLHGTSFMVRLFKKAAAYPEPWDA